MVKLVELNSAYSLYRQDVAYEDFEPSMTRQDMADECDINKIMARYEKSGLVPANVSSVPQYLDLTMAPDDLMQAMNLMIDAETSFMALPASTRKEFDNDPMRFVEFASNPDNVGKLREWGLAAPEKPQEAPPLGSEENPIRTKPIEPAKT